MKQQTSTGKRFAAHLFLVFVLVVPPGVPTSLAAPQGEQVTNGQAEFVRDGSLTVIRASDGAIINYQSFDIHTNESVEFVQPDAASRVLNRVQSFDPTHIDGSLQANGIVYIVNPVGVFFGSEAIVDVGGLVAASGHLSDADFLGGVDHFTELAGAVENRGEIRAGGVALIGRSVANHGSIVLGDAGDGLIALVAGEDVFLTRRDAHVVVRVDAPLEDPAVAGIEQTGTLDAGGGGVVLTTGDLYSLGINHDGITRGGDIQIAGGDGGLVRVSGSLDASNTGPGASGGSVEVTGDRVALIGADVDASGSEGGGAIRIGGERRGGGDMPTARRTVVDAASSLRADALVEGDGGEVIVWADEATAFQGEISARGGIHGGNGGFAEVSAPVLHASGSVDLGAPEGESGTLLYDPQDIVIVGGTMDGDDAPDLNSDILETDGGLIGEVLFGDIGTGDNPFEIYESEIESIDANIVLEAENSITVSGTFDHDGDGAGLDDPGLDVVLIQPGNSLTLRTRNEPGDDTGSGEAPGIDLTDGGALAGLEWRTTDGNIVIRTGNDGSGGGGTGAAADLVAGTLTAIGGAVAVSTRDGAIDIDRIDTTTPVDSSRSGGSISVSGGGTHDVTLGDLVSAGADGVGSQGAQGNGGAVTVTAEDGSIEIAGIDSSGGSGEANGGNAGRVRVQGFGVGGVTLLGDIVAIGGDRSAAPDRSVFGGTGGQVTIDTVVGDIALQGVDASGGAASGAIAPDSNTRGGGGAILVQSRGIAADDLDSGNVVLNGVLRSEHGSGDRPPFLDNSQVTIILAGGSVDGADIPVHINADSGATLRAGTIGVSRPIVIQGGTSEDGLVQVIADGSARVDIDTPTIDQLLVQQNSIDSEIEIQRANDPGAPVIEVVGDPDAQAGLGTSTITRIDTTDADLDLNFIVTVADADLIVPSASTEFQGDGTLQAAGDVVLGTGSGPAIEMAVPASGDPVALVLNADLDGDGQGSVDHDGGDGPNIVANGDVTLAGTTIGAGTPGKPIEIEGGGEATGLLALNASGDIDVDVETERAFDVIVVTQGAVAADTTIDQIGGDVVRVVGSAASEGDPGFVTVEIVDTADNGTGFGFNLTEEAIDANPDDEIPADDPDLFIPTLVEDAQDNVVTGVKIGGSGLFSSTGDLVLGDSAGTGLAIGTNPSDPENLGLALEADRNLNGNGAIFNGAPDVTLSIPETQVMLFASTGIGTPDNPIVTVGAVQIGAQVREAGGIYVNNTRDGQLAIAETGPPAFGGVIRSVPGVIINDGTGDIEIVHSGGDISVEGTVRNFGSEGDVTIGAEDDGSVIFLDADPDRFALLASVVGTLTWGNPVVLREDVSTVSGDIVFAGSLDSDASGTAASLLIETSGSARFGGSIGATAPLETLRIQDTSDIFDPTTGIVTPPEGNIQIDGESVATEETQFFGNSVLLGQDTTFIAFAEATDMTEFSGDAITFLLDLDGPGAADIETGIGDVRFGGNIGAETRLSGLSVEFTGDAPGTVTFVGTETVATGDGGIAFNPDGRDAVPEVATVVKTGIPFLVNPPNTGFPDAPKPASSVGPLTFSTTGDFVVGRNEKIAVADKLSIEANHVEAGDLSAFKIDIDSASYTILGRDPGNVILAGGGVQMDNGVDIVANRVILAANPMWDGVGTAPTFFTQTGGVDAPGNLQRFDLRMIDERGSKVALEDFTRPTGTVLDLTGNGPFLVGNPATENVQEGNRVGLLIPPRSSRTEASTLSEASAAEVLATLECADLGRGVPTGCTKPATSDDRALSSARASLAASAYRETSSGDIAAAREALHDALAAPGVRTASGTVDGPALRRRVSAPPGRAAALAYLDQRNQILTELRLLNVSEATSTEVEHTLLDRWSSELGLPGLDATALGSAIGSARNGLVL